MLKEKVYIMKITDLNQMKEYITSQCAEINGNANLFNQVYLNFPKHIKLCIENDDVVLHHTLPIFMGLGQCPIVSWDFAGAVSNFGPDALPVIHQ